MPRMSPLPRRPPAPAARALAQTLAWLRVCAVAGQAATVLLVAHGLNLPIPEVPLFAGIAALGVFAAFAVWRLGRPWPVSPAEVVVHIAVDTLVLGWLLHLTGGARNPFVSLLLMPITLAAAALSLGQVGLVALFAVTAYAVLLAWYEPLPVLHLHSGDEFDLHVIGMGVSFSISAALLGWFIGRLAGSLRDQQAQVQRIRERALRDAGILAIATQAAGAAHELNTPLSTMRTLLTELRREHPDGVLGEDLSLLDSQVERCRESLRELVAVGKTQLSDRTEHLSLGDFVAGCLDRFHLLRPEISLDRQVDEQAAALALSVPVGLRHAVLNLLNNAADASLSGDSDRLALDVRRVERSLEFRVRDFGPGPSPAAGIDLGRRFDSTKTTGLGIGFALADATAERLGGTLALHAAEGGGAETVLAIPLAALLA